MKKSIALITLIAMLTILFISEASARWGPPRKNTGSWSAGTPYGRMYNPQTVETISGAVVSVDKIIPMKGMNYGVHIVLKTDRESISVHLGPGWYIDNQDVRIAPGDKVEVIGSRITFEGNPALIAAEIRMGDQVLALRDANGFPVWSGWRRR